MGRSRISVACFLTLSAISGMAYADDGGWLQLRDQNPFVLGSGLPLLPQSPLRAGSWSVDASIEESNTQLISSMPGRFRDDPGMHVIFGAETRESRISVSYAFSDEWVARASIGDEWIGVGFLDKPIQHFHDLIGAPQGYRDGKLGYKPPIIRVTRDGQTLYSLDNSGQAVAPLLLDLTRTWSYSPTTRYGISFGIKAPIGDTDHLSDVGDNAASISAFGDWLLFDSLHVGARVGYMYSNGNDVLPEYARSAVPFGDVYARLPLFGRWSAILQSDAHGALYRNVPIFLGHANLLSIGLVRAIGQHSELQFGLSEDVPIDHTQDVALMVSFKYHPGD